MSTAFTPHTLEHLRAAQHAFATERQWHAFHTPRNLVLALTGEVGELAELFQWRSDAEAPPGLCGWSAAEREHLGEELSDVLLYLLRLSDVCGVDLGAAVERKMAKNAVKYPAERVKGRSDKYDRYEEFDRASEKRSGGSSEQQRTAQRVQRNEDTKTAADAAVAPAAGASRV